MPPGAAKLRTAAASIENPVQRGDRGRLVGGPKSRAKRISDGPHPSEIRSRRPSRLRAVAVPVQETPQRGDVRQTLGRRLELVPRVEEVDREGDRIAGLLEHAANGTN